MSEEYLLIGYVWMVIVYTIALIEHASFNDIATSLFAGVLWPVTLPVAILCRLNLGNHI